MVCDTQITSYNCSSWGLRTGGGIVVGKWFDGWVIFTIANQQITGGYRSSFPPLIPLYPHCIPLYHHFWWSRGRVHMLIGQIENQHSQYEKHLYMIWSSIPELRNKSRNDCSVPQISTKPKSKAQLQLSFLLCSCCSSAFSSPQMA